MERVDSSLQHGEVPGTEAYNIRDQDAVPDQIEVIPDGSPSRDPSPAGLNDRPTTPGDSPIPRTMIEKVDPDSPSYGEVPGTEAFEKRQADAVPDFVKSTSDPESVQPPPSSEDASPIVSPPSLPIPETHVSRVDSLPMDEDSSPQLRAHHRRSPSDATPDVIETVPDTTITPESPEHEQAPQDLEEEEEEDFGEVNEGESGADDFDEFVEEQNDMGDDDFGDFNDDFQEASPDDAPMGDNTTSQQPYSLPSAVSFKTPDNHSHAANS